MRTSDKVEQVCASMFAVHRDLMNPSKDAKGQVRGKSDYRYLSLPSLIDHLRPKLKEAQLFVTQEDIGTHDLVMLLTTVFHFSGQFIEFGPLVMPAPSGSQERGSAITYARRYALAAAFNLAADEDDDGAKATKQDWGKNYPASPAPSPPRAAGEQASPPGHDIGEGVTPGGDQPASTEQWERLVHVAGGSMTRAVNRLNKVNQTNYTKETAVAGATHDEVAAAITGGT